MILKYLRYTSLAIILFIVTSLALMQVKSVKLAVFSYFAGIIESRTGYQIDIDDIELMLPFEVKVSNMIVYDPDKDYISARRGIFRINPSTFFERKLIFHSILLEDVALVDVPNSGVDDEGHPSVIDLTQLPFYLSVPQLRIKNLSLCEGMLPQIDCRNFNIDGSILLDPQKQKVKVGLKLADQENGNCYFCLEADFHQLGELLTADFSINEGYNSLLGTPEFLSTKAQVHLTGKTKAWEALIGGTSAPEEGGITGNISTCFKVDNKNVKIVDERSTKEVECEITGLIAIGTNRHIQVNDVNGTLNSIEMKGTIAANSDFDFEGTQLSINIPDISKYRHLMGDHSVEGEVNILLSLGGIFAAPTFAFDLSSPQLKIDESKLQNLDLRLTGQYLEGGIAGKAEGKFEENNIKVLAQSDYEWIPNSTQIALHRLHVDHPGIQMAGEMSVDYSQANTQGTLKGNIGDLNLLQFITDKPLSGSVSFEASLTHTEKTGQGIDITLNAPSIAIGTYSFKDLHVISKVSDLFGKPDGVIDLSLASATDGEYALGATEFYSSVSKKHDRWPFKLKSEGTSLYFDGSGVWFLNKDSFYMGLDHFEGTLRKFKFLLFEPTSFSVKGDAIDVAPLLVKVDDGSFYASIDYKPSSLHLTLRLVDIPIPFITSDIYSEPIDGLVTAEAHLYGPATKLLGKIKVDLKNLSFDDALLTEGVLLKGNVQAHLLDDAIELTAKVSAPSETPIDITAKLPATFSLSPLALTFLKDKPVSGTINAHGSLTPLLELFPTNDIIASGVGGIEITLGGTLNAPQIHGQAHISNGTFESYQFGTVLKDIQASFQGDGKKIAIRDVTANDGKGGTVHGNGEITLSTLKNWNFSYDMHLNNLQLIDLDNTHAHFDGDINVSGNSEKIVVKGELTTTEMDYAIAKKIEELTDSVHIIYVNQNPEERTPTKAAEPVLTEFPIIFDINIKIPDKLQVNDSNLQSVWKGEIKVSGEAVKPDVKGEIKVVSGIYMLNGQQYELRQGTLTFHGGLDKKSTIYVVTSREINDYQVDIILQGNLSNPKIILRSTPALPQQEILSLILFGKSPSDITTYQDQQLEQSLSNLMKGNNDPGILDKIQKSIGIDRIDINRQGASNRDDMSIQLGKYITKDIFISLNKGFGEEPNRVALEAKLKKNIKIKVEAGDQSTSDSDQASGMISIIWKHDY